MSKSAKKKPFMILIATRWNNLAAQMVGVLSLYPPTTSRHPRWAVIVPRLHASIIAKK
jgi:hypothetical protein